MLKNKIEQLLCRYLKELNIFNTFYKTFTNKDLEDVYNEYCENVNNYLYLINNKSYNKSITTQTVNLQNILSDWRIIIDFNRIIFLATTNDIVKFFNDNNIYDKLIKNIFLDRHMSLSQYHQLFIFRALSPLEYLKYAFDWHKTVEGEIYWREINKKFINEFTKI